MATKIELHTSTSHVCGFNCLFEQVSSTLQTQCVKTPHMLMGAASTSQRPLHRDAACDASDKEKALRAVHAGSKSVTERRAQILREMLCVKYCA